MLSAAADVNNEPTKKTLHLDSDTLVTVVMNTHSGILLLNKILNIES